MNAKRHDDRITCTACPHGCTMAPDQTGLCRNRGNLYGHVEPLGYGHLTALAIDPVEKKPLARWNPGKLLLSAGSCGCNLHCPFCQNHHIAQHSKDEVEWGYYPPGELVDMAHVAREKDPNVIGIAHTYNEPLIAWEYVAHAGILAHRLGLTNVIVSNGYASPHIIDSIAPVVDAANIDLKAFTDEFYRWCGGDLATVQATIERLAAEPGCHLEVTCLVVPGHNDTPDEMRALSRWLAGVDPDITLHVSRFFPRWKMAGGYPTPVETVYALADVAREALPYVYTGNC